MGFSEQLNGGRAPSPKSSMLTEIAQTKGLITTADGNAEGAIFGYKGAPVGWSHDLERILALHRRSLEPEKDLRAAEAWTKHLRRERPEGCDCDARWGVTGPDGKLIPGSGCLLSLNGPQGWSLEEASDDFGLFGNVGVGHGKTGIGLLLPMAIPGVKTAVLLIPAQVKRQLLERDYAQWAAHFKVPHLAGHFVWPDQRPVLKVITYSELQLPKNSDILTRHGVADLVIADEGHHLKDKKGTRWKRIDRASDIKRFFFCVITGTPTDKSIKEYDHLIGRALGHKSPVPLHGPTVDAWASALDAGELRAPMGSLVQLCKPGENVQEGFARRVADTHGVIVTSTASVKCGLVITALKAPGVPNDPIPGYDGRGLADLIEGTRNGERPDGEQSMEALTAAMWSRQLAAGFHSYWNFPRGEPDELIKDWFEKRKNYHKEVRAKLKYSAEFADSPLLIWNAAVRWHDGYSHEGKSYPKHCKKGPMPVWDSEFFLKWREIKDKVFHETKYKWLSDYLVDATVEWAKKNVGIIWVEHHDFGQRVATKAGIPFYDGKGKNPELDEKGNRSIVASIAANDTGKNLQKLWHKNCYPNPFTANKRWEQSLGRTHRMGQPADEVTADVFLHTPEMRRAFDTALMRARYVKATGKAPPKLTYATIDLTHAAEDERKPREAVSRWFEDD